MLNCNISKKGLELVSHVLWSNGLVFKVLEPLDGSKVDSAFHPSEVGKMSTKHFWELSGKK